jgi:hypothetical protein
MALEGFAPDLPACLPMGFLQTRRSVHMAEKPEQEDAPPCRARGGVLVRSDSRVYLADGVQVSQNQIFWVSVANVSAE